MSRTATAGLGLMAAIALFLMVASYSSQSSEELRFEELMNGSRQSNWTELPMAAIDGDSSASAANRSQFSEQLAKPSQLQVATPGEIKRAAAQPGFN